MADRTRPLLVLSLFAGLALILIVSFTSSEHTLTLALGTLFATSIGFSLMLNKGTTTEQRSSHIGAAVTARSQGQQTAREEEDLPDPLALNFDIPL